MSECIQIWEWYSCQRCHRMNFATHRVNNYSPCSERGLECKYCGCKKLIFS